MKLKMIQNLICSDLTIINGNERYNNVYKYGGLFDKLKDKEIIGIRSVENVLIVSIK